MMLRSFTKSLVVLGAASCLAASSAWAVANVGKAAPDFTLTDVQGKTHKLSQYKGKNIVLEWANPECPFVQKHYGKTTKNMPTLQSQYAGKGVVWLTILSTAKGKEGYMEPAAAAKHWQTVGNAATAVLMDTDGKVGKQFDAKTTPHMYVIDSKGNLVYKGAIDNKRSTDEADVKGATNYVTASLDATLGGKPVAEAETTPYGCGVKY